jgi:hypothetical protein
VPAQIAAEPPALLRQRGVYSTPLFVADFVQLAGQPPPVGPTFDHEAAVSTARAVIREAK